MKSTTKTTRETNTKPAYSSHAANAICITREIFSLNSEAHLSLEDMEDVSAAAFRLNSIEETTGFAWEDQKNDWETVCSRIADHLMTTGLPDAQTICKFIGAR